MERGQRGTLKETTDTEIVMERERVRETRWGGRKTETDRDSKRKDKRQMDGERDMERCRYRQMQEALEKYRDRDRNIEPRHKRLSETERYGQ